MPPNQGAVKLHLGFQSELRMIEYEDCCFLLRQVLQLWQKALFRTLHHEFIGDDRFTMVYYDLPRLPTNIPLGCKHPRFTNPEKNGGAPIPSQALKVHCCKKAPQRHGFVWARLGKICTALQAREQVWLSTDIDFPFKIILWYPFVTVHLHSHYSTMHWNQLRTTAAKRP